MEDLAYRRLLDLYYSSEKPITNDIKKLSRLISLPDFEDDIKQVLEDFFESTDDGYVQNRVVEEIAKYHAKADAARANGKKGGRPKKAKQNPEETEGEPKKTQSDNLANPEKTGSKANQEPITNNQETVTNVFNTPAKPSLCGVQFETRDGVWICPDDYYQACCDQYGQHNVDGEFKNAAFWLLSNPAKRKTARGMKKFLGSWLQRKAERDPTFKPVELPTPTRRNFHTGELTEQQKADSERGRALLSGLKGNLG